MEESPATGGNFGSLEANSFLWACPKVNTFWLKTYTGFISDYFQDKNDFKWDELIFWDSTLNIYKY